jgi:glycosyltransferase involved in cell wall biosynthesis
MVMEEIIRNNNLKITYFFQSNRKDKKENISSFAQEMFYGYFYFKNLYKDVEIVEFKKNHKTKMGSLFFRYIEKNLRQALRLPLYWSYLISKLSLNKILSSDLLIFSTNRMGCSAVPMILVSKLLRKKNKSVSFILGLFSRTPKYKIFIPFQRFYIMLFLKNMDKLIFLSEGEFEYAIKNFNKYSNKYFLLPFAVDLNIWNLDSKPSQKKGILFVGNDGFRNYDMVLELEKQLDNLNFTIVSSQIENSQINNLKTTLINGSWNNQKVTDLELKKLYQKASVTIIPLIESLQPSGQSVALQSIACGTPVIITKTEGFWDKKSFADEKNIFFVKENTLDNWCDVIDKVLTLDKNKYQDIINNGVKTINSKYDLKIFNENLEKIITNK